MTVVLFTNRDTISEHISRTLSQIYNVFVTDNVNDIDVKILCEDVVAVYIDMNHSKAKLILTKLNDNRITSKIPVIIILKLSNQYADIDFGWANGIAFFVPRPSVRNRKELMVMLSRAIEKWKKQRDPNQTDPTK